MTEHDAASGPAGVDRQLTTHNAPSAMTRRLFFALWPPAPTRDLVQERTARCVRVSGGRMIAPENLHITLSFLGAVAANRFDAVIALGHNTNAQSFTLTFDQVESWRRSGVLCLTTSAIPPQLNALQRQLQPCLLGEDETEHHPFRPHVTLVRRLPRSVATTAIEPLHWRVEEFVLVESQVASRGCKYEILDRWPLRGDK